MITCIELGTTIPGTTRELKPSQSISYAMIYTCIVDPPSRQSGHGEKNPSIDPLTLFDSQTAKSIVINTVKPIPGLMPLLPPPPHPSSFSDPGRCRRRIRLVRISPSDGSPLPWDRMPMMSLDNSDGWIRCGGAPLPRRGEGHAHGWSREICMGGSFLETTRA